MGFFENTFVIIHIRTSGLKVGKFSGRKVFTFLLILMLLACLGMLFDAYIKKAWLDILSSFIYVLIVLFVTANWMKAWPKANKMLSKASDLGDYWEKDKHNNKNAG